MKNTFIAALAATAIVAVGSAGCSKPTRTSTTPSGATSATTAREAGPRAEMAWQTDDVTALAGAPAAAFVLPASYVSERQRTQHLIYLGFTDNHLHELWADQNGWHTNDLTAATGAPEPVPGHLAGYTFEAQGTQHVMYVGASDNHIHELWWDATGWHTEDLTAITGATGADLAGYAFEAQGTLHVFYTAGNRVENPVHELWWNSTGWHTDDLGTAGSDLAAYVFQGTQHVIYSAGSGAEDHMHELWWDSTGRHTTDLTAATGDSAGGCGDWVAYAFDANASQHVFNVGCRDQHVHELWSDTTGWHTDDLTALTGAPPVQSGPTGVGLTGYAFEAQGTQHVFYVSYLDNHIHELWWGPKAAPQPGSTPTTTRSSTAPSGPAAASTRF